MRVAKEYSTGAVDPRQRNMHRNQSGRDSLLYLRRAPSTASVASSTVNGEGGGLGVTGTVRAGLAEWHGMNGRRQGTRCEWGGEWG